VDNNWGGLGVAMMGFFVAFGVSSLVVNHLHKKTIKDEGRRDSPAEEYLRFIRQDMAIVVRSLGIANGLLGAIVAVLASK
jgi:hypothetical protein